MRCPFRRDNRRISLTADTGVRLHVRANYSENQRQTSKYTLLLLLSRLDLHSYLPLGKSCFCGPIIDLHHCFYRTSEVLCVTKLGPTRKAGHIPLRLIKHLRVTQIGHNITQVGYRFFLKMTF